MQHAVGSGVGAGWDRRVSRLVAICCSLCCCCAMLRSSEERLRLLSVRQGLVVTDVRCACSGSVVAPGATWRGGDEDGVWIGGGGEDVDSLKLVICGSVQVADASGCSMCWRAAVWYSDQVRGRCVTMSSVRMMWCHVGTSSCCGVRLWTSWNWDRNVWSSWSSAGCCNWLRSVVQCPICVSSWASWADHRGLAMTGGWLSCAMRSVTLRSTGKYTEWKSV